MAAHVLSLVPATLKKFLTMTIGESAFCETFFVRSLQLGLSLGTIDLCNLSNVANPQIILQLQQLSKKDSGFGISAKNDQVVLLFWFPRHILQVHSMDSASADSTLHTERYAGKSTSS